MIIPVYKPRGWSSFDVVRKIKNLTQGKYKVGHGGTLDPFAEGLLILGLGRDTKALSGISQSRKTYRGVLQLGKTTDTLDPEGKIIETAEIPDLNEQHILKVFKTFTGKQKQVPPMYSAKRKNGVRLYKLARQDRTVEREPVAITIYSLGLIKFSRESIEFETEVSKGTYIRVLGADIARALGTVGYLTNLIRTKVGNYSLEESATIEELAKEWKSTGH